MNQEDLRKAPYCLDDDALRWVNETLAAMSTEDKIGHLFFLGTGAESAEEKLADMDRIGLKPGGYIIRRGTVNEIRTKVKSFQDHYEIPLLIAADLDRGSTNILIEGTCLGHYMEIAATQDPSLAYKAGRICGEECAAVGINWDFGPVTDIDWTPRSPIVNVRSFSSDPDMVLEYSREMARGLRDGGLLACAKHWPGDGVDDRDQHFLASRNTLSMEDWDRTYGRIYGQLIEDGVETVMTAHIVQTSYAKHYNPETPDSELLPGSLNKPMHEQLLRGKLGFNGLIITDASTMGGFTEVMPRSKAVPACIAAGADMFLFVRSAEEDYAFMKQGYADGVITPERLDEAVTRILALKACKKLRLHEKKAAGTLVPPVEALSVIGCEANRAVAAEIADRGITLVKNTEGILPLDASKQPSILMLVLGDKPGYHTQEHDFAPKFAARMEKNGFRVTTFNPDDPEQCKALLTTSIKDMRAQYDVILYFANCETSGGDSATRLSWPGQRAGMPNLSRDIPTVMVSIDWPYCLYDAPRISAYVNAYTSTTHVVEMLADKVAGLSPFKGVSPVDAFAGLENARA